MLIVFHFDLGQKKLDLAGFICAKKHLDVMILHAEGLQKHLEAEYSNNDKLRKEGFEMPQFIEVCERGIQEHEKILSEKLEMITILNSKIATLENQLQASVLSGVD